jgi:hypothetical protein
MTSAITPSSFITALPFMSVCMKAPGMLHVATLHSSTALMTQESSSASVATVGEDVSCFVMQSRCFRPSAQPRPLIVPQRFSFRNIRYLSAPFLSSAVKSYLLMGSITLRPYSCCSSARTAAFPLSPKLRMPCLRLYWVKMTLLQYHVGLILAATEFVWGDVIIKVNVGFGVLWVVVAVEGSYFFV